MDLYISKVSEES